MRYEFNILRPVNPEGISFIKSVFGAIVGRMGVGFVNKYKKMINKLIVQLGYRIADKVGEGKLITGEFFIELDENKKPIKLGAKKIKIYEPVKEFNEEIVAE